MRQHIIIFVFFLVIITSCNGQNSFVETRIKTAGKFIECLTNNTPDKILEYTYPDVDHKINNKEFRDFYVNKAFRFIKKFGLPSQDKWIIKYEPQNNFERLQVIIPVFKGYDSTFNLLQADIVLSFPPPQISDKIYNYEIADKYDITKVKLVPAPIITDSVKRKQ